MVIGAHGTFQKKSEILDSQVAECKKAEEHLIKEHQKEKKKEKKRMRKQKQKLAKLL